MKHSLHSLAIALLFVASTHSAVATTSDSWPIYQANPEHNGYIHRILVPRDTTALWSIQAQAVVPSGLAISNGRVFTTPANSLDNAAPLVAQSLVDGHVEWSVDFGTVFSVNQPAIDSGAVYLQTSNSSSGTFLHAYAVDGTFLWRTPFDSQWEHYLGPIVVKGTLYFDGGAYGGCYSMSSVDGAPNWFAGLPQYDKWSPTWDNGVLVTYTNELDVITPDTGLVTTTITDPDYVWSGYSLDQAPVIVGNYAYVTNGGRLVAFDLQQQNIAWARAIYASGQVATDGTQLFVTASGALSVRDPVTGNVAWSWIPTPSGSVMTNIIVTDSHVIAGDGTNTYLISRATHQTVRTYPASGMLAYGADTLVIADVQGMVHAFTLPTDEMFANSFE